MLLIACMLEQPLYIHRFIHPVMHASSFACLHIHKLNLEEPTEQTYTSCTCKQNEQIYIHAHAH